jgi:type VI secretion system secreted protein VgrG
MSAVINMSNEIGARRTARRPARRTQRMETGQVASTGLSRGSGSFSAERRLYRLDAPEMPALAELTVEAWAEREVLNEPWSLELVALGASADLDLDACIGQSLHLVTRLPDGSEHLRAGVVLGAQFEEADGGLCRYRLQVGPWLALLGMSQHAQVWQERPLTELLDSVFALYAPLAQ